MRCNILIWCFWLFSLCFVQKGVANVVLDPQTNRPISADSILNNVMTFAPFYEKLVTDYRADLYIKGTMDIKRKNFILRYVPSMFRLQKGVRQYMVETYSDLHFTAPNIYDQKVKASMGTVHNSRGVPGMLEYFNINLYSSTLLYDRLLSPLAKNGRKYYKYLIDSIMGGTDNRQYKIRFIPRSKSDQLVGGYMIVSSDVWSVREIRFSGRSELVFLCIGSDRVTGDCLGPYIGHQLLEHLNTDTHGVYVYGTLKSPVHALNLSRISRQIKILHPEGLVIAVDASLGHKKHLGYVTIADGALYPGAAVQKELPPVGDIHITGIVNIAGVLEQLTLQTTRLSTVISLADTITQGIVNYTNSLICL